MIKLIIVAENDEFRNNAIDILKPFSEDPFIPFSIYGTNSYADALSIHKDNPFDLFFIDIDMQNAKGIELVQQLKLNATECEAVILSKEQSFDNVTTCMRLGASDYLLMPIKQAEFVITVIKMVNSIDSKISRQEHFKSVENELDNKSKTLSFLSDITEKERHRVTVLIDAIDEAVIAIDTNGLLITANRRAGELFDPKLISGIGLSIKNCIECKPLFEIFEKNYLKVESKFMHNNRYLCAKPFQIHADSTDVVVGHLFMITDETETHANNFVRETMLSAMAHELRTPLTALRNYLFVSRSLFTEAKNEMVENMELSIDVIAHQIDKLLRIAQFSDTALTPHIEKINLHKLLIEAKTKTSAKNKNNVKIITNLSKAPCEINSDYYLLMTAIDCLLDNSLKFSSMNGTITIDTTISSGILQIKVADDGQLIPPHIVPLLFIGPIQGEKYDTRIHSGMGTGLYAVKKITDKLGGIVCYKPNAGKGCIFTIEVPC